MTTMFERLTSEMVLRRVDEANELARHALDTGQREVAAEALGLAAQYVQLAQNLKRIEEAGLG